MALTASSLARSSEATTPTCAARYNSFFPAQAGKPMFLSVKEMEVRKVRFDETFQPGEIDFSGAEVRQSGPLHAEGVAELFANTDGEIRIKGRLSVKIESECDRCLGYAQ